MNPLVSVITPTYNHQRFIAACIESVQAQDYDNWEMIIVDDGSTDQTWDVVQRYAIEDRRIQAIRQENKGIWRLAETYNLALERSHGELIGILEGDDQWAPSKLATQVPLHMMGGYALSFGQIQFINESGALISRGIFPDSQALRFLCKADPNGLFVRHLRGEYPVPALTVLISREKLIKIDGFQQTDYLPLVDYPTWMSLGATGGGYCFVAEARNDVRLLACNRTLANDDDRARSD